MRLLISTFDYNHWLYVLIVFPIYQAVSLFGMVAVATVFVWANVETMYWPLGFAMLLLLGVPIFATWHLSFLLFGILYFRLFAAVRLPFMAWAVGELEGPLVWFRKVSGQAGRG